MAVQATNYKCPACTGPLHYDGESGKLKCDYCESTFDVEEIEALYAEPETAEPELSEDEARAQAEETWNTAGAGGEWGEDAEKMRVWSCPSCGAEIFCDETTAATSCPYCGNPTVEPGQFKGTLRPDYVLPFKLDKEAAIAALKRLYQGKRLLPKAFSDENHIREIKGVYVPFWLFDGEAEGSLTFHAISSSTHREGDYRVTNTRHYDVGRSGTLAFEKVPVDGSSKMPDELMDSIEPYDYADLVPFSMAYLPGFLADKYDVAAADAARRVDQRCRNTIRAKLRGTVEAYQAVTPRSENIAFQRGSVKYALMPVWLLATRWNGKHFLFAMNGQTGKIVGDLPVDKRKERCWFWGVTLAAAAVLSLTVGGPIARIIASMFFG